jgi:hypothetical protein
MNKFTKVLGAAAVATLVGASGSAFTAANTVSASNAGSGATAISGFAVSDIQYDANATDPTKLDAVRFTLDKTARYTAIKTSSASTTWYRSDDLRLSTGTVDSCQNTSGNTWKCDVTGKSETVAGATEITVVATN